MREFYIGYTIEQHGLVKDRDTVIQALNLEQAKEMLKNRNLGGKLLEIQDCWDLYELEDQE